MWVKIECRGGDQPRRPALPEGLFAGISANIGGVVENGIAEQDDVYHCVGLRDEPSSRGLALVNFTVHRASRYSVTWGSEAISGYDFAVIVTDHDILNYHMLTARARLVVDTRNASGHRGIRRENVLNI
jgi:hypothetical protein